MTQWATGLSLVVVATALLVTVAVPDWGGAGGAVLVAGLVVGLPHGAVDHLIGRRGVDVGIAPLCAAYVLTAGVAWAVMTTWPLAGLAGFVLLSMGHFGAGEAEFAKIRGSLGVVTSRGSGFALGVAVVALPLTLHLSSVVDYVKVMAPSAPTTATPLVAAAAVTIASMAAFTALLLAVNARHPVQILETSMLLLLAVIAPPAVTIGVYFGGWHSVRHLALLMGDDAHNTRALASGRIGAPLRRFARQAALPTVAAGAFIAALWWWSAHHDVTRFVAVDLTILAALTVPHTIVVALWNRARANSTRPPGSAAHLPR